MKITLTEDPKAPRPERARSSAYLYRVLNADAPLQPSARLPLADLDELELGRDEVLSCAAKTGDERSARTGIPDGWMSSRHARLARSGSRWVLEDTRSRNGVRVDGVAVERVELHDGAVLELGRSFFVFRAEQPLADAPRQWLTESKLLAPAPAMRTLQPELGERFLQLAVIAQADVTVALRGPSGSGKELVAQAVHKLSGRKGAFIAVNCGALPDTLVEAELYGHRKGAFSGATEARTGLVRAAEHGTLFLDEIGDLPLAAQPALLRVLQEREVLPLGATEPVSVDVRVVSATHRDLATLEKRGSFRPDLRARLSGFELELPSLAERREDLGLMVSQLLTKLSPTRAKTMALSLETARRFLAYDWPLNIRELEKVLEPAVVLAKDGLIRPEQLPKALAAVRPEKRASAAPRAGSAPSESEDQERRARLEQLLREHGGNVSAVARAMGKARMQIQRWMARYGFDAAQFRDGARNDGAGPKGKREG